MAVVDVYDALTSSRPYKPAYIDEKAMGIMRENSGTHFDPEVFAAFENAFEQFCAARVSHSEAAERNVDISVFA